MGRLRGSSELLGCTHALRGSQPVHELGRQPLVICCQAGARTVDIEAGRRTAGLRVAPSTAQLTCRCRFGRIRSRRYVARYPRTARLADCARVTLSQALLALPLRSLITTAKGTMAERYDTKKFDGMKFDFYIPENADGCMKCMFGCFTCCTYSGQNALDRR